MNRRQFLFTLAALALVGWAGLVLLRQSQRAWSNREARVGDKALPNFHLDEVAAIHIKGSSDVHVARKDGLWRVRERADYPANFQQVKSLLLKMQDLKVVQSEEIGPSQLAQVDLEEPGKGACGGALLEFENAQGKLLDSLLVGKKHERQQNEFEPPGLHGLYDGRYILQPREPNNVLLISDELATVAADPEAWLSRDFFKIQNIQSISLISTNPNDSWELARENESGLWTLGGIRSGEAINTDAVTRLTEILEFLSFVDVIPGAGQPEAGLKPLVFSVSTLDHFAYTLKIGPKRPDGTYPTTFSVGADLLAQREPGQGESPEDARKLDAAFQGRARQLQDKLARESRQAGNNWVYLMGAQLIEPLIRTRAQLVQSPSLN